MEVPRHPAGSRHKWCLPTGLCSNSPKDFGCTMHMGLWGGPKQEKKSHLRTFGREGGIQAEFMPLISNELQGKNWGLTASMKAERNIKPCNISLICGPAQRGGGCGRMQKEKKLSVCPESGQGNGFFCPKPKNAAGKNVTIQRSIFFMKIDQIGYLTKTICSFFC